MKYHLFLFYFSIKWFKLTTDCSYYIKQKKTCGMKANMYEIDLGRPVHVYFIGIGGISMSGLAQLLLSEHFRVSGSDRAESHLTDVLAASGARIFYGQKYENITSDIDVAVYTSAISRDNPELMAVNEKHIPALTRAQLLGQVMKFYKLPVAVSGTHGKTTTTSMISEILLAADLDPTLSIGGVLKSINGNFRVGGTDYFVTEACEYTNSFLSFFPKISIILNIDADHLDFFKDINDIRNSFHTFAKLLPADGTLIINGEIPDLGEITSDLKCRIVTFGTDPSFDYYADGISTDQWVHPTFDLHSPSHGVRRFTLGVSGVHNVYNAMAAIAFADMVEVTDSTVSSALSAFHGTDRRFQFKGTCNGFSVIDDYAHHPTEIKATLTAARKYPHKKLWCVFQPHTYTRTKALLPEFAQALSLADHVILADIYAARETDHLGISSATLRDEIIKLGTPCEYYPSFDDIKNYILKNCTKDDLLITMGAGNIVEIGDSLIK
jgi:UDP-N-acetylmuramate--alanine ligase